MHARLGELQAGQDGSRARLGRPPDGWMLHSPRDDFAYAPELAATLRRLVANGVVVIV